MHEICLLSEFFHFKCGETHQSFSKLSYLCVIEVTVSDYALFISYS